jgi:hypothetical protein
MVILAAHQNRSASVNDRSKRIEKHPCDGVVNDTVIHTLNGDIVCLLPTEEKLKQELDTVGGYNRHYVSNTLEEAKVNFKNLFETYGENYTNTTAWQSWHLKDASLKDASLSEPISLRSLADDGSIEIQKREENVTAIQCLSGGRETVEGKNIHLIAKSLSGSK